ncbi:hypothetical protein [Campylobacter sp. RM9328]|uniref:hypothetical protein n=1 Tax=Campylobacter sp. RM9328 TaxID=1705720 RepID=UPI0014765D93|nr:hypothetical protein [Campylobacter sp. RM9328]
MYSLFCCCCDNSLPAVDLDKLRPLTFSVTGSRTFYQHFIGNDEDSRYCFAYGIASYFTVGINGDLGEYFPYDNVETLSMAFGRYFQKISTDPLLNDYEERAQPYYSSFYSDLPYSPMTHDNLKITPSAVEERLRLLFSVFSSVYLPGSDGSFVEASSSVEEYIQKASTLCQSILSNQLSLSTTDVEYTTDFYGSFKDPREINPDYED